MNDILPNRVILNIIWCIHTPRLAAFYSFRNIYLRRKITAMHKITYFFGCYIGFFIATLSLSLKDVSNGEVVKFISSGFAISLVGMFLVLLEFEIITPLEKIFGSYISRFQGRRVPPFFSGVWHCLVSCLIAFAVAYAWLYFDLTDVGHGLQSLPAILIIAPCGFMVTHGVLLIVGTR